MRKYVQNRRPSLYLCICLILGMLGYMLLLKPQYITVKYLYRVFVLQESDVDDHLRFPAILIENDPSSFVTFPKDAALEERITEEEIAYTFEGREQSAKIQDLLQQTGTTSFIILKDGKLVYEQYFNGTQRDLIVTSMSMAKSVTSALCGIALHEGKIKNIDDSVVAYLPELQGKIDERVTIKHLLLMTSGFAFNEAPLWWGDDTKSYYATNLRQTTLKEIQQVKAPGEQFLYNDYNTILLGMILERVTGTSVSKYTEERLWKPLGAEYSTSWSLDSDESGFEKMASGFNGRAIDYAKFGQLYLTNGVWEGKQLIPESWVRESTLPSHSPRPSDHEATYYAYFWWGIEKGEGRSDFFARGKYGQYIFVSPEENMVIVRTGRMYGEIDSWTMVFQEIGEMVSN